MSERSPNKSNAGLAIAGLLAAGLVAAVAQAPAWAGDAGDKTRGNQKKEAAEARKGPAAQTTDASATKPSASATTRPMVTRSVGGVQVTIDPATGRVQQPSAEQIQMMTAHLQHLVSRNTEGLPVTELPGGGVMVNLDDTFQEIVMASVDRKGQARLHCVNDEAQMMAILNGTAPVSSDAVYKGNGRDAGKKAAPKAARSAAERE